MDTRKWKCSISGVIVIISSHSWRHLQASSATGWVYPASAATSWAVEKSLACQKIADGTPERSFSCWFRVSNLSFVRPSRAHLVTSYHVRFYFLVWSLESCIFASRRQYEATTDLSACSMKATRLREALAITPCSHRLAAYSSILDSRWEHVAGEDSRIWVFLCVIVWLWKRCMTGNFGI